MDDFKRTPVNRIDPVVPPVPSSPAAQPPRPSSLPIEQQPTALNQNAQPVGPRKPGWATQEQVPVTDPLTPQPLSDDSGLKQPKKKSKLKVLLFSLLGLLVIIAALLAGAWFWYNGQLAAVNSADTSKKVVTIESGSTPTAIAATLKTEGLIRSEDAFLWYTKATGVQNKLQAGTYRLSPSESTQQIVDHLSSGKVDTFSITFLPGTTLKQQKEVLIKAGYNADEVEAAFAKTYQSPLFDGKPASADLEGYIYPETYSFGTDTSVEAILEHIFEQFYAAVQKNNLVAGYQAQGLSLYEGIIMASIIQKEAVGGDERQIAQVFLSRYEMGMALGSDPTYQYIADKEGQPRDLNYDSPYNTRRYTGIPPGPIANAGLVSLQAIANPADGDYLYFLSGDDDITYFSRTFAEHERNIADHCKVKCQAL